MLVEIQEALDPQKLRLSLQKKKSLKKSVTQMLNLSQNTDQACSYTSPKNNINTSPCNSSEKSKNSGIEKVSELIKNAGIKSAITRAQEKVGAETKEKDEMWRRIAKAVDVALSAEAPGKIEEYQIQHIVKAILDWALPKVQLQAAHRSISSAENINQIPTAPLLAFSPANKAKSWAKIASKIKPNGPKTAMKPLLKQSFQGMQADSRLMVCLKENSPHRNEHLFLFQKRQMLSYRPT